MNQSPTLTNDVRFCVSGTVTIHPTAAIATNVILRANPGSCLVIEAGTVIGKGCIVQSYGGSLIIEEGVTLGSQVLLMGQGVIQKNACIGAQSTLMALISVSEGAMIPAHSLLGAPEPQLKQQLNPQDVPSKGGDAHNGSNNGEQPIIEDAPAVHDQTFSTENADQPPSQTAGDVSSNAESSALPHPNSHRMFMPINTPRYSGGAVDQVNEGRELGSPSSQSDSTSIPNSDKLSDSGNHSTENPHGQEKGDSIENASGSNGSNPPSAPSVIYGKASVQRLMTMMFPYRTLNDSGDDKE